MNILVWQLPAWQQHIDVNFIHSSSPRQRSINSFGSVTPLRTSLTGVLQREIIGIHLQLEMELSLTEFMFSSSRLKRLSFDAWLLTFGNLSSLRIKCQIQPRISNTRKLWKTQIRFHSPNLFLSHSFFSLFLSLHFCELITQAVTMV